MNSSTQRTDDYAEQDVQLTLKQWQVDPSNGLSENDVEARRQK